VKTMLGIVCGIGAVAGMAGMLARASIAAEPATAPTTRPLYDDWFVGTWKVKVRPDAVAREAGAQEFDDVLTFHDGALSSEACGARGFTEAIYHTAPGGISALSSEAFSAVLHSSREGTAHWNGTTNGTRLAGSLTCIKENGSSMRYKFEGERQTADDADRKDRPATRDGEK
jgi:hypothetical protein